MWVRGLAAHARVDLRPTFPPAAVYIAARPLCFCKHMHTYKSEEERSVVAGACGVSADWDCGSIAGPVDGGSAAPRSAAWTKEDGGCACRVRLRVRDGHGHPARAAYALTHRIGEESCLRPRHPLARQPLPLDMLQDVVAAFMGFLQDVVAAFMLGMGLTSFAAPSLPRLSAPNCGEVCVLWQRGSKPSVGFCKRRVSQARDGICCDVATSVCGLVAAEVCARVQAHRSADGRHATTH